jgi:F-type H+-transporting ATPase subunit b
MQELLSQLGINWKLFLSQAVNFGLLLIVLRIFAYKPLLALMRERREKIEQGLVKAEEADKRLIDANEMVKEKMKGAEQEGLAMLRKTEEQAKALEARLTASAHEKEALMMKEAEMKAIEKQRESEEAFRKEAAELVRMAIVKTVEMSPEAIDKSLIEKAVKEMKHTSA